MTQRFHDAKAFRASLEQRIRDANLRWGTPHDRLRKDVAFHRLIARFIATGDDRWVLKGAVALLWRVAADARATRDIDTNWRGPAAELETFLDQAVEQDMGDWFRFEIGSSRPLRGETEAGGGLRFPVVARLDGREFTAFHLDVNLATDARPVEFVTIVRPLLAFVDLAHLDVPMISVGQHVAEKLHAVVRMYSSGDSSRVKDAFDPLLLAQTGSLPDAGTLRDAVDETFAIRNTELPATAPALSDEWRGVLKVLLADFALPGIEDVDALAQAWRRLWELLLNRRTPSSARWDPTTLSWTSPDRDDETPSAEEERPPTT